MNLIDEFHSLSCKKRIKLCKSNFRGSFCANCKKLGFHTPQDKFNIWCYEIENCVRITHSSGDRDMYLPYDINEDLKGLKKIWK